MYWVRALAISSKTVCSCAANPWTVATRLGMRSARRCRTTSTCAQLDLTCSLRRTISLRLLAYQRPKPIAKMRMTAITPMATFMDCLRVCCFAVPSYQIRRSQTVEPAVHFVGDYFYELQVGVQACFYVDLAGFAFSFANVKHRVKCGGVGAGECGDACYCFAFAPGHGLAQGKKRVAKERAESGNGLSHDAQVRFVA